MILVRFHHALQNIQVLDPACGSGNFLYVTLQRLKDLEKEVILYSQEKGFGQLFPTVGPWQMHGIEVNPYAFDLAQMTVWIGYLQWTRNNGFGLEREPILRKMETFENKDAILCTAGLQTGSSSERKEADKNVGGACRRETTLKIRNRGYLPHWEASEGCYFITFRLADTLPRTLS